MKEFILIMISTLLGSIGQICLKKGMSVVNTTNLNIINLIEVIIKSFFKPFIIIGIVLYVFSLSIWLVILSRVELSYARPLVGVGYVVVVIFSWIFLQEKFSFIRLVGVLLITSGVYFVQISQ